MGLGPVERDQTRWLLVRSTGSYGALGPLLAQRPSIVIQASDLPSSVDSLAGKMPDSTETGRLHCPDGLRREHMKFHTVST
jgi:hypothetical protein